MVSRRPLHRLEAGPTPGLGVSYRETSARIYDGEEDMVQGAPYVAAGRIWPASETNQPRRCTPFGDVKLRGKHSAGRAGVLAVRSATPVANQGHPPDARGAGGSYPGRC